MGKVRKRHEVCVLISLYNYVVLNVRTKLKSKPCMKLEYYVRPDKRPAVGHPKLTWLVLITKYLSGTIEDQNLHREV